MTECERLIQEGKLPAEFIQPEQREVYVSGELKKLWALQIDMIEQVDILCKKYGLQYFAVFGTALGAIRHNGFIPWDDDVDLALKRPDYNRFCEIAQKELPEPYFLQLPTTDKNFYCDHVFLRNSNATCIVDGDGALKVNNGALIHIMPIDVYINNDKFDRYIKRIGFQHNVAYSNYHYRGKKTHKLIRYALKMAGPILLGGTSLHHFIKKEKYFTELYEQPFEQLGFHTSLFRGRLSRLVYDKHVFDDVVTVPFEYTSVPIPIGWQEIFQHAYGDYMKMPPEEKRVYKHSWEAECDVPYQQYCREKYGVEY